MVKLIIIESLVLRKKFPYLEISWSVFSLIRTEYRETLPISPYSVQMYEVRMQMRKLRIRTLFTQCTF